MFFEIESLEQARSAVEHIPHANTDDDGRLLWDNKWLKSFQAAVNDKSRNIQISPNVTYCPNTGTWDAFTSWNVKQLGQAMNQRYPRQSPERIETLYARDSKGDVIYRPDNDLNNRRQLIQVRRPVQKDRLPWVDVPESDFWSRLECQAGPLRIFTPTQGLGSADVDTEYSLGDNNLYDRLAPFDLWALTDFQRAWRMMADGIDAAKIRSDNSGLDNLNPTKQAFWLRGCAYGPLRRRPHPIHYGQLIPERSLSREEALDGLPSVPRVILHSNVLEVECAFVDSDGAIDEAEAAVAVLSIETNQNHPGSRDTRQPGGMMAFYAATTAELTEKLFRHFHPFQLLLSTKDDKLGQKLKPLVDEQLETIQLQFVKVIEKLNRA